ncbi:ABC transporter ATP-binding protein [Maribrevibacterium harenarium]|uniref:ABC transporter ATP-binding protein n=1 Tax=Maribrevibacterium harenarium TaxID=2589817 RepID=UPI001F37C4D6|nr:ATP-binding cassette domain-containing protein [Maribrevibacterium harenarium]
MATPIIELDNISAFRGDHPVFQQLNLTIHAGEKVAILGPNGAGKSTFLKLITREIYPLDRDDSRLALFGKERFTIWSLREQLGVISQDLQDQYTPYTTGIEVILSGFFGAVGSHGHLQPSEVQIQQAEAMLDKVGMGTERNSLFDALSTGQRRRLLVGRALIHNPSTLIFDEPTNGLDIRATAQLLKLMREHCQQQDHGLLLTTHHVDEIIPEIERVIVLQDGKIIADGEKQDVLNSELLSHLYNTQVELQQRNGFYRLWIDA